MKLLTKGISDDIFITEVAKRHSVGTGVHKIAKELSDQFGVKVAWTQVEKALQTDKAKGIIEDFKKEAYGKSVEIARKEVGRLVPLAVKVLEDKLKKSDLKAAGMVFEIIGAKVRPEEAESPQSLTVILPGAIEPAELKDVMEVSVESNTTSSGETDSGF